MNFSTDTLLQQRFEACLLCGAIGDAWGSSYEFQKSPTLTTTFYFGKQKEHVREWAFTDDTQLSMATCETLCTTNGFDPAVLAGNFVRYYREKKLTGLGSSTLKAIVELQAGGHWSQVGRSGEFAAGNGAAMRIAPFAFFNIITRENIRDACRITHKNDEAYVGALAIVLCLKAVITQTWTGENNLFDLIIPELPDTKVRDRLIEINNLKTTSSIKDIAILGNNGYVVNSVPFANSIHSNYLFVVKTTFLAVMSILFLSVSGCTDDHQSKKIDATTTDSLQYNRRQFAEYLSSYPAIPDSAQFMAALRDTFHLAIYEYPTRKGDEKITIYQKVKLFGSPKEYFLIEYDWGVGSTGNYPWKYQLLINEEGRSMGTVSAEQVRLVNVFPEQNPFLLARLVTGKGNGGHHLYSIKADTLENVYEGYYDYTLKTYDRHMDMAVFNPAELNIRFADNNHDGFNDIIFTGEKLMLGGFTKDSSWYDVLIKAGKEIHYSPEHPAARIPIKYIFLYDQKTGHFKSKEPYRE